jgi:hypothetical protein
MEGDELYEKAFTAVQESLIARPEKVLAKKIYDRCANIINEGGTSTGEDI